MVSFFRILHRAEGSCQSTRILPQFLSMRRGSQQGARALQSPQNSCLPPSSPQSHRGLRTGGFPQLFCVGPPSRQQPQDCGTTKVPGQFATFTCTHVYLVGGLQEASPSGVRPAVEHCQFRLPPCFWRVKVSALAAMTAVVRGRCSVRLR